MTAEDCTLYMWDFTQIWVWLLELVELYFMPQQHQGRLHCCVIAQGVASSGDILSKWPHWGHDKIAAILQTFSNAFAPIKM